MLVRPWRRRNALHSQGSRAISRLALQRALSLPRMGLQPAANAHLQSPAVLLLRPAVRPLSTAVLLLSPAVRPLSTAVRPLSTAVAEMSTTGEGESSEAPALPTIIELPTVAAVLAAHLEHGERYGPADHALSWSRISHLISALDAERHALVRDPSMLEPLAAHAKQVAPSMGPRQVATVARTHEGHGALPRLCT